MVLLIKLPLEENSKCFLHVRLFQVLYCILELIL